MAGTMSAPKKLRTLRLIRMPPTNHVVIRPVKRNCGWNSLTFERCGSCVYRLVAELLLDTQELVVLREPFGAGKRPGLDQSAIRGDCKISNGRVFGLP